MSVEPEDKIFRADVDVIVYVEPVPQVHGTAVTFPITPADVDPDADDANVTERLLVVEATLPGNDEPLTAFKRVLPPAMTDTPSPAVVEKSKNETPA